MNTLHTPIYVLIHELNGLAGLSIDNDTLNSFVLMRLTQGDMNHFKRLF